MNKNSIFRKTNEQVNSEIPKDSVIAIRKLSKKYPGQKYYSIEDLNIDIKVGQFHAFVGSNGAGKTTTIKAVIGATKVFEGDIYIDGISNISPKALSSIAYIPEYASFPATMTLLEFLNWNAKMLGLRGTQLKTKVEEVIAKVGLQGFERKRPRNFSSGEQKKVLLAQTLLKDSKVFVMDEPAANLDPQTRYELFQLMKGLQKEGKAILISSHVLSEVQEYADSVTIIEKGKIKISGPISQFSGQQKHSYSFEVFDELKMNAFLEKKKNEFKFVDNKFRISFNSQEDLTVFLDNLYKYKIYLKSMNKIELGLKDIYTKHVLKANQKMH